MDQIHNDTKGYVYILQVKDIDLPVCKIGMTVRSPYQRCAEINNSSTGDFIWDLAYYIAVDDCRALESLVHTKLQPLKQRRREFINLNAEDAYKALLSIIDSQCEIKIIDNVDFQISGEREHTVNNKRVKAVQRSNRSNEKYVEMLDSFTGLLGIKGRPFGQLNKPVFGMSDGNDGVQWNIAIFTDSDKVTLGVNLEGMAYCDWPIAKLLLSESRMQSFSDMKKQLSNPDRVTVRFMRDAWQVTSRPYIVEQYIGGKEFAMSEIGDDLWLSLLNEAMGCLDETKGYRGRKLQEVTLVNKQRNGEQIRKLQVSPHLNVWTSVSFDGDLTENLRKAIEILLPVYEWMKKQS